ncbi:hypothetical protein E1B28_007648 [Marasmius oreades]|uniref:Ricin B lectin domain-containing protein n=1 Tax=Marasmius oreades TaxID=181124 RepID=A0A9P7S3H2_9AGAR|nr:uncharacterized protein E1B28_007648 [Marasmius oreades]KAG7094026.1 hypothetical protein E1B28_007648 [Marasmius oreades]
MSTDSHLQLFYLKPGTYRIINVKDGKAIDLSGADGKSIISYAEKGDSNQLWIFKHLGAGHSIQSACNGMHLSVNRRNPLGNPIEASRYPVSWELDVFDFQDNVYRGAVFDARDSGKVTSSIALFHSDQQAHCGFFSQIDLQEEQMPIPQYQLWRLVQCVDPYHSTPHRTKAEPDYGSFSEWETSEQTTIPPASSAGHTKADTVIDAEGLKIGGNGEIGITTTTTTTTVTQVKRLNVG